MTLQRVSLASAMSIAALAQRQTAYERVELQSKGQEIDAPGGLLERGRDDEGDSVPEFHEVKPGETLSNICEQFFGSSSCWPRLWAFNPQITNPHWIYPGDRIRLMPPEGSPEAAAWSATKRAIPQEGGFEATNRLPLDTLFLRQHTFVEETELRAAGTLVGAKDDKMMLTAHDDVYVHFDKKSAMRPGDRYSVYQPLNRVVSPSDGHELGWLIAIIGSLEVREISKAGVARATLTETFDSIERGARVGPVMQSKRQLRPERNDRQVEGVIAAALPVLELVGPASVVVIDRGQAHGIRVGNRLFVMRAGDRLEKSPPAAGYPPEVVGEIVVLQAKKNASVGVVTRSQREIQVGDRLFMQRGY